MAFGMLSPLRTSSLAPIQRRSVSVGIFKKKKASAPVTEKEDPEKKDEGFAAQTLNALNFSAKPNSAKDADLLYEAKYGKRAADGKMTPEQYAALRRKVGGTAKDYFKDWVEEEQVKIPAYFKPTEKVAAVPFLPLLVGILFLVLGTTVVLFAK